MEWSRRIVLGAGVAAAATALTRPAKGSSLHDETGPAQAKPPKPFALEELTIRELNEALVAQRYTSRQLTEAYLARIEEADRKGRGLRPVLDVNPDALRIAHELDNERRE